MIHHCWYSFQDGGRVLIWHVFALGESLAGLVKDNDSSGCFAVFLTFYWKKRAASTAGLVNKWPNVFLGSELVLKEKQSTFLRVKIKKEGEREKKACQVKGCKMFFICMGKVFFLGESFNSDRNWVISVRCYTFYWGGGT